MNIDYLKSSLFITYKVGIFVILFVFCDYAFGLMVLTSPVWVISIYVTILIYSVIIGLVERENNTKYSFFQALTLMVFVYFGSAVLFMGLETLLINVVDASYKESIVNYLAQEEYKELQNLMSKYSVGTNIQEISIMNEYRAEASKEFETREMLYHAFSRPGWFSPIVFVAALLFQKRQ
jgi:hypothetical protein